MQQRSENSGKRTASKTHRRESIAGVGNQHAGFADGAIADGDAFYESRGAHFPSPPYELKSKPQYT